VVPDHDRPAITEFRLSGGAYREMVTAAGREPFVADAPFPVEIIPAKVAGGTWRR